MVINGVYIHLLYFDENEWPDDGARLLHAPSLPVDERHDKLPTPSPASSPTADDPDVPASPVADDPNVPASAEAEDPDDPAALPPADDPDLPAVPADDGPGTAQDAPAPPQRVTARSYLDTDERLDASLNHVEELIPCAPGRRLQKRCRVCTCFGKRSDTRYRCAYCKVPLCVNRLQCFVRYHTVARYWIVTPQRGAPGAHPPQ